jgi:hypothetical protein
MTSPDDDLLHQQSDRPPAIPAPAAVAGAVAAACGVRLRQMPVKLEDLVLPD